MNVAAKKLSRAVAGIAIAASITMYMTPGAEARIKWSPPIRWDGATMNARLGLPYFSDMNGCGAYDSLAKIDRTPRWLRNTTSFTAYGIGATVSVASFNGSPSYKERSITNTMGQRTSYMAGNVCANWSTFYLGMAVTATAYYNGQIRDTMVTV